MKGVEIGKMDFLEKCVSEFNEIARGKLLIRIVFWIKHRSISLQRHACVLWLTRLRKLGEEHDAINHFSPTVGVASGLGRADDIQFRRLIFTFKQRPNDPEESMHCARAKRAAANLQESLPAFLVLSVLSVIMQVDNSNLMICWLAHVSLSP